MFQYEGKQFLAVIGDENLLEIFYIEIPGESSYRCDRQLIYKIKKTNNCVYTTLINYKLRNFGCTFDLLIL